MVQENCHSRAENGQNAEPMTHHLNGQDQRFGLLHDCDNAGGAVGIALPQPACKTAGPIAGGCSQGETKSAQMTFSSLSIV
jgi:hypothetical protein